MGVEVARDSGDDVRKRSWRLKMENGRSVGPAGGWPRRTIALIALATPTAGADSRRRSYREPAKANTPSTARVRRNLAAGQLTPVRASHAARPASPACSQWERTRAEQPWQTARRWKRRRGLNRARCGGGESVATMAG